MTRSILCGLLGLISVVTLGTLPVACQSGGVGDPCVPEDEYNSEFAGFKMTEENIESRSFQCSTRICLVNHFQGRVSCPRGQPAPTKCTGVGDTTSCSGGATCVEASTLAPDCTKATAETACARAPGTTCDVARGICTCNKDASDVTPPEGYSCVDNVYKTYVCHNAASGTKSNCQTSQGTDKDNTDKECCLPGTDNPVATPVCGQCGADTKRSAEQAVYCSCRCLRDICKKNSKPDGAKDDAGKVVCNCASDECEKEPPPKGDENFNFCTCPSSFKCTEIRKDVGLGDARIAGSYCIKDATDYKGDALECGDVKGYWDSTCRGSGTIAPNP